jgi:integrase
VNRERTAYETKRLLNRHFKPKFQRTKLGDIQTARIAELLDDIKGMSERRHAFAALWGFFRYMVRRGLMKSSPCDRLQMPGGKGPSRERILSDDELAAICSAAEAMGYPFGTITQLLILTGQRRGEIGGLCREWIKADRIEFPAEIMKAKKRHTIPLAPTAKAIIDAIPVKRGFLFPARRRGERDSGERAFNGWSKDKAILERRITPTFSQWGLHDLRRTVSTRWAELGVPPHINDMLLAHTMQGVSAVHRVYNLATYLEPMGDATDLGATIEGPTADLNLGLTTYLNGVAMSPIQLDTSEAATDTIDYVATDQSGLTSTTTRTVLIQAAVGAGSSATTTAS